MDRRLSDQISTILKEAGGKPMAEDDVYNRLTQKYPEYVEDGVNNGIDIKERIRTCSSRSLGKSMLQCEQVRLHVRNPRLQWLKRLNRKSSGLVVMCSGETSPVPSTPSTEVKQKKRVKRSNAPLSLNDNLHSA